MRLLFNVILIFLLFDATRSINPIVAPSTNKLPIVAKLTLSNPYVVCRDLRFKSGGGEEYCKKFRIKGFTIHGLWEQNKKFTGYDEITTEQLKEMLGSTYMKNLERLWPNYHFNSKVEDFWRSEFNKHGRKLGDLDWIIAPRSYFDQTVRLSTSYNIRGILDNRGINGPFAHDISKIRTVLKNQLGVNVDLICTVDLKGPERIIEVPAATSVMPTTSNDGFQTMPCRGKNSKVNKKCTKEDGYLFLKEIHLCFGLQGRALILTDCPCKTRRCSDKVHVSFD